MNWYLFSGYTNRYIFHTPDSPHLASAQSKNPDAINVLPDNQNADAIAKNGADKGAEYVEKIARKLMGTAITLSPKDEVKTVSASPDHAEQGRKLSPSAGLEEKLAALVDQNLSDANNEEPSAVTLNAEIKNLGIMRNEYAHNLDVLNVLIRKDFPNARKIQAMIGLTQATIASGRSHKEIAESYKTFLKMLASQLSPDGAAALNTMLVELNNEEIPSVSDPKNMDKQYVAQLKAYLTLVENATNQLAIDLVRIQTNEVRGAVYDGLNTLSHAVSTNYRERPDLVATVIHTISELKSILEPEQADDEDTLNTMSLRASSMLEEIASIMPDFTWDCKRAARSLANATSPDYIRKIFIDLADIIQTGEGTIPANDA